jgi:hypothetical protein
MWLSRHDRQHATAVRKLHVVLDIGLVRDWTRILTERLLILARECQDPICCHLGSFVLSCCLGCRKSRSFPFIWVRLLPELPGDAKGVDLQSLPPGHLISCLMELSVVTPTKRDREFVADFGAQRTRL